MRPEGEGGSRGKDQESICSYLREIASARASTKGLMADIPQAFEWVAKRKTRRIEKLKMLEGE